MTSLPSWIDQEAWAGFVEMRKAKKKAPWTSRAQTLILKTLYQLKDSGHDPNAALDQSTVHGWADVYAPKGKEIPNMNREYMTSQQAPMTQDEMEASAAAKKRVMDMIRPAIRLVGGK